MSFKKEDYTLQEWIQSCILCTIDYDEFIILGSDGYFDKSEEEKKNDWTMPVLDSEGYYSYERVLQYVDDIIARKDGITDEQAYEALARLDRIVDIIVNQYMEVI
jgi:hypothetical protein